MGKTGSRNKPPKTAKNRQGAHLDPSIGKNTTFDKRQPTPAQKSAGWAKKRTLKEILALSVKGTVSEARRKELLEYLGLPDNAEVSIEQMLHLKQIVQSLKSIKADSTVSYNAIMNRAFGLPKQAMDVTSDGKALNPPTIIVQDETTKQAILKLKKK